MKGQIIVLFGPIWVDPRWGIFILPMVGSTRTDRR